MKRKLQILAFAAIVVATLASCAKEQLKENVIPAGEKIQVSITGQIGDFTPADATKATAESVVRVTWAGNDKVYVYDGSAASIGTLTVTPDENNASYALLSGEITASAANPAPTKLTLVYVKGAETAPAITEGKISVDLSTQNQSEVPFVLYSTIDYDANKLTKNSDYLPFSFATSVMTVNCTNLPVGEANAKISITKAEIEGVSTICELTVTGTGVTIAGANKGTITRTETSEPSVFTQSDSRGAFRLALVADPETPAARNILVFQGTKVSGSPFTTTKLEENCSYNTVYQMGEYVVNTPKGMLSGEFTVAQGKKVYFSQGNLTCDISGATPDWKFYEHQYDCATSYDANLISLFTWGYDATKSIVPNGKAYDYVSRTSGNLEQTEDWGCTIGDGNTWRTLTKDEWTYLFNTRTMTYNKSRYSNAVNGVTIGGTTYKGVFIYPDNYNGDVVSDYMTWDQINAAGIVFLPAAGNRSGDGSNVVSVGEVCYYWSSTASGKYYAYTMFFTSSEVNLDRSDFRSNGYSVRLITESAGGYTPAVKVTGVSLNKSKTTIKVDIQETLVATVTPANAANKQVNWSSSDVAVATVDENGNVTGVAEGSAVITATTADGNFTAVCLVKVRPTPPAGALSGEFSVSNDGGTTIKQVYFSKGNLVAEVNVSGNATNWNFAANQYDYVGNASGNATIGTAAGLVDLFGWSTNAASNNWGIHKKVMVTAGYTDGDFKDWGKNIGDGNTWRTLSKDEWTYLFNTRIVNGGTGEGKSFQRATINSDATSVYGMILYPDGYNSQTAATSYTSTEWESLENAGCVFLPAAGLRDGSPYSVGDYGGYWSSTAYDSSNAYCVIFKSYDVSPDEYFSRIYGYGVRLVTDVK